MEFFEFVLNHNRPPLLDQGEAPHLKCGWLRYYLNILHGEPSIGFPDRWGYLRRFAENPHADPGPIPQVDFKEPSLKDPLMRRAFQNMEACLSVFQMSSRAVSSFFSLLAWAGGLQEECNASPEEKEKIYRLFQPHLWLEAPTDYPSLLFQERNYKGHAWFPTPFTVVEVMLSCVFSSEEDNRGKIFNDPCCGTGRFALAASNKSLYLSNSDIDLDMVTAAKVNALFYAPWMVCKIPKWLGPFKGPPLSLSSTTEVVVSSTALEAKSAYEEGGQTVEAESQAARGEDKIEASESNTEAALRANTSNPSAEKKEKASLQGLLSRLRKSKEKGGEEKEQLKLF